MTEDDEQQAPTHAQALGARPVEVLREAAGFAVRRLPSVAAVGQVCTAPDDSQTGHHSPAGAPVGESRRHANGPVSAQLLDGTEAAESLTGLYGRRRFPVERRTFPKMDDDFGPEETGAPSDGEVLLELPPQPELPAPRAALLDLAEDNPGKPRGPNYDDMRPLIVAAAEQTEKSRLKWRRNALDLPDDMDEKEKNKILNKEGRLQVAGPETRRVYLTRGDGLLERYKRETGTRVSHEDLDPRQFVNWLLGLKPVVTDNTWRGYRACATAVIQSIPSVYLDEALGMLHADLQVGSDEGPPAFKPRDEENAVGASLRAKRIDYQHFQLLKRSLRVTSRSKVVGWLTDSLDAGIHTGLRPMEWALTTIERRPDRNFPRGERIWLHVVSAKAAEGRATTHRTLDISNFSIETLGAVERVVERSREWVLSGRWASRQSEVSRLFRQTCEALFPRMQIHYTLHSLRHQFIANMKTIYTREQVAAMADHVSIDTQVQHYTKRRSSWSKEEISDVPVPVEGQVARIKRRLELLDERRAVTAMKQAAKAGVPGGRSTTSSASGGLSGGCPFGPDCER
jgi:hypothetical protein